VPEVRSRRVTRRRTTLVRVTNRVAVPVARCPGAPRKGDGGERRRHSRGHMICPSSFMRLR
jgi:hypothetical protein